MNKGIQVRLAAAKTLRLVIAIILLFLAGRVFKADAQILTNLYSIPARAGNLLGAAVLVQGNDGYFYGTTEHGITNHCDCGTVFRFSPNGGFTSLHEFDFNNGDGIDPRAGLVQGSDGNFYGTTWSGGANDIGTVFRISPSGNFTNLYSFKGHPTDGEFPTDSLVQGSDGNFYGTTYYGGTNADGTAFKISPSGNLTIIHVFGDGAEAHPNGGLVQGSDGNFYGTTTATNGQGTVFSVSPSGGFSILHQFSGGDGLWPYSRLVQGGDGNFYGTTQGTNGHGTVFSISSSGSFTNLCESLSNNGGTMLARLVQGSDGYFYGTTDHGGGGDGSVFRISSSGNLTNVWSFSGPPGGYAPIAGLVQGSEGSFYGTTTRGGTKNSGIVFQLIVPLNPPANQISGIQLAGSNAIFSIPSVAGETYQLQFTDDLTSGIWSNMPESSVTNGIGGLLTLTSFVDASQPQGFYRFAITP